MTGQDPSRNFLVVENQACNVRAKVILIFRVSKLVEAKGSEGNRRESKRSKSPGGYVDGSMDGYMILAKSWEKNRRGPPARCCI